ncbi:hypothetical protein AVEN_142536-1 [Araneus ventricosus]|uniref:Uncharacterized protein n=1 Tax=Araneus ventricosus TaxID=182803 RepID=A0A4Y2CFW1_ARAVE|nr:hypothetical protein AVEN_142536-1 [Araneus ventricosus]
MAAVRIALRIYYDSDVEKILDADRNLPKPYLIFDRERHELWKQIKLEVVEKLSSFLPTLLRTRVARLIEAMHLEAELWIKDHNKLLYLCSTCFCPRHKSTFCWKTDGSINRIETAKKFAQNKNIDPNTLFIMACTYFLEDEVLALWHGNKRISTNSIIRKGTNSAVRFWMKWLKKGSVKPWRLMVDDYFRIPCIRRSDIRLRLGCIFPYLSQESRKNYFQYLKDLHKDDFRVCLYEMDGTERRELFERIPVYVLYNCLKWPFQTSFIGIANQLWSHMTFDDFDAITYRILIFKILRGLKDFDYVQLLKEFWHLSPSSFKEEMKMQENYFKMIEIILNYDRDNQILPLEEILDEYIRIYDP